MGVWDYYIWGRIRSGRVWTWYTEWGSAAPSILYWKCSSRGNQDRVWHPSQWPGHVSSICTSLMCFLILCLDNLLHCNAISQTHTIKCPPYIPTLASRGWDTDWKLRLELHLGPPVVSNGQTLTYLKICVALSLFLFLPHTLSFFMQCWPSSWSDVQKFYSYHILREWLCKLYVFNWSQFCSPALQNPLQNCNTRTSLKW